MKSNELLSYLSDLELKLNSFSFEELTAEEATRLKKSFQSFKENLEVKTLRTNDSNQRNVLSKREENIRSLPPKAQEMFIAKINHEIRTPLNGIIGFTGLLAEEKLSETQLSHVNAIQSASNSILNSINELIAYSKLKHGDSLVESTDFNIKSLLKDVSYLCNTLIVNPEVDFNVSIPEDIPEILVGDPSKLSQVLLNLIGNAIKYVTKGSIDLILTLAVSEENAIVINFIIKDTSISFEKNNLKSIFEYYKQADQGVSKNYEDTGLGLSIVKHIIETLNGKIIVSSELSVGTIFNFSLPYQISQLQKTKSNISQLNTIKSMKTPPVISKVNLADPFDVDLAPVLEECFGDIEMLEELVRLYKQNAVEFIGKTRIDLKATDIEGLRFNTHKVKSGLKMMQTFGLFRIVEQMHKICIEDQDFKYLNFLFDCFLKEYPIVENAIEKALENLKNNN